MNGIKREYIDYDLTVVPQDQSTGWIEQTDEEMLAAYGPMKGFEEEFPEFMVSKADRKAMAAEKWPLQRETVRRIYSQGRTSACVGFGAAQALETHYTRRFGAANHVPLSGMSVYKEIGRSLMSGAYIPDGMNQIGRVGALPLNTPENKEKFELCWDIIDWSSRFPNGWEQKCPCRVTKFAKAQGPDEIESALLHDFVGIVGRSSHCVPYVGLTYDRDDPIVPYANSWGNWGDEGFGYDSKRVYGRLTLFLILEVAVPQYIPIPDVR